MLTVFGFLQVYVQASIWYCALPATSNIVCICLRPSFEHRWVSCIGAENTLFNLHVQLEWVGIGNEHGSA